MSERVDSLRAKVAQLELDAILISQGENRRYLSRFTGSAGYLLISQNRAILATDFRYVEQAKVEAPEFQVVRTRGSTSEWFPTLLSDLGVRKLGFEGKDVSYTAHRELLDATREMEQTVTLVPTDELVESLRAVKDEEELRCLEQAAALSDGAFEEIMARVVPGIPEKELAWELESLMRRKGSDPLPFDIIVASGPNSALPHAKPTDRLIQPDEPVVIDFGATVAGYSIDTTRTVCFGEGDGTFRRVYDIVLGAQLTALATMQAGMSGEQVDRLARTIIAQAGYEDNFGHGLGHGVGLAAHEEPRLGPGSSSAVADGMVFTVEPGIYVSGWGGVRIEDTFVLEGGKARPLTKARKNWR